jgi:hypothetical protein
MLTIMHAAHAYYIVPVVSDMQQYAYVQSACMSAVLRGSVAQSGA